MQPDMYVNLLGSTVEFKMDIREPTRLLPQALANMVSSAVHLQKFHHRLIDHK